MKTSVPSGRSFSDIQAPPPEGVSTALSTAESETTGRLKFVFIFGSDLLSSALDRPGGKRAC